MRRTEFLISELRQSTDNTDTTAVKDSEIIGYLNSAQRLIQNIIFKNNPKADIFKKTVEYDYDASGEYELPSDIFAVNGIHQVCVVSGDESSPIDRIDPSEARSGYYTKDNTLVVKGLEDLNLEIICFRKLPKMDKRWGRIQTVNAGVSLVLASGFDSLAETVDDYVSAVDKFGDSIRAGIRIDTFTSGTWATTDALTGVTNAHYVCMGENSVNKSQLSDECETYLMDYARQRLYTRNNYEDAGKQVYFTDKQEADIAGLFARNDKDNSTPPVTDYDALDF